ncbi:uncharacterized protein LOC9661720 [Selaginella moellendorffii]|uniref:uncharacterized protein LOC9661720 n=1 Tax=Selaginella moellendorffii TaxID=88036 RepID=UPI000D1CA72B|nr:uncharacterized protein LOC9661720 [Selaginella moellendorffii]|eukprot:XP_024543455.1 uncharacterized protein LOC9661720 [Selaginella moellendorffii]
MKGTNSDHGAAAPAPRIINPSVHEALIKLIPIQAQKIREKGVSRFAPQKEKDKGKEKGLSSKQRSKQQAKQQPKQQPAAPRAVRWEDDEEPAKLQQSEEFDKIWENDCETRALACQDKLTDLLCRYQSRQPDAGRLTASLEVLKEVCQMCVPFSHVLTDILQELELALYISAEDKEKHELQVPYFELVGKLEHDIKWKEDSQQGWRSSLTDCQERIERIEETMTTLSTQVKNADFLNKNLHASLTAASDSLNSANDQVHKSKQKLVELKQELKDAKAEVRRSKSMELQLQHEKDLVEQDQLKAEYAQLVTELQHFQTFLDAARNQISVSVPRPEYMAMKAQMLELQKRLADIQAKSIKLTYQTAHLTPRPSWTAAPVGEKDPTLSTLEQVAQICRENAILSNKLAMLQSEWTNTNVALAEANEKYQKVEEENKKKK